MIPTFFNQEYKSYTDVNKNYADIGIIGISTNISPSQHMGSSDAPNHLRNFTYKNNNEEDIYFGFNPFNLIRCVDFGDLNITTHEIDKSIVEIGNFYKSVLVKCPHIISVGGDQSITYPILKNLHTKYQRPISIIHFDSFPDCEIGEYNTSFMYQLISKNIIIPNQSIQIGIRSNQSSSTKTFINKSGLWTLSAESLHSSDINAILGTIHNTVKDNLVYISFDASVFDPACCPAASKISLGGLNAWQILKLLHNFQNLNLIGMDITEFVPKNDLNDISTTLYSTLIWKYMCLIASKKGKKG